MKTKSLVFIITIVGLVIYSGSLFSQKTNEVKNYLESLPKLNHVDSTPQSYLMTTDYQDHDMFGKFIRKKQITGECTLLKDGFVKWNKVKIAHSQALNGNYPEGDLQNFMENFTYNMSSDILSDTFFNSIPQADVYMKNLIWDLTAFETFAWSDWDSLKLNNEFSVNKINFEIDMPGVGTFVNKDIRLTWIGITEINKEICAIIKYSAMNNPLKMKTPNVNIKGRSHYWGNVYVSLSDRQIEFADLYEDVVLDIKIDGQNGSNIGNTVRTITLEKIR